MPGAGTDPSDGFFMSEFLGNEVDESDSDGETNWEGFEKYRWAKLSQNHLLTLLLL